MSAFCLKVEEKASVNSPISRLHTISAALLSLACLRAAAVEIYANGDIEAAQGRHRRFDFDHRTRTNLVRFLNPLASGHSWEPDQDKSSIFFERTMAVLH